MNLEEQRIMFEKALRSIEAVLTAEVEDCGDLSIVELQIKAIVDDALTHD